MRNDSRHHGRYPIPWACDPQPYPPSGATVRLGIPASWEDCEALGLNPHTGEKVRVG